MRLLTRKIINLKKYWNTTRTSYSWYQDVLQNGAYSIFVGEKGITYTDDNWESFESVTLYNSGTPSDQEILHQIAYGNDIWVCVGGKNKISYSSDLANWTSVRVGSYSRTYDWKGIVYANDTFYAIGTDNMRGIFAKSSDGQSWTVITENPSVSTDLGQLDYGNNYIVSCLKETAQVVKTSVNDTSYNTVEVGTTNLQRVRFLNNKFIAVGDNGISISTDLTNWEDIIIADNCNFNDISYGGGRYTLVGNNGKFATSVNLYDWNVEQFLSSYQLFTTSADNTRIIIGGNQGLSITKKI